MKVFVTGATGFIGSAVVNELLGAGHQVLGLARNETSAQKVINVGAEVHYGDLNDLESIKSGAQSADGIIHLGFIHDFTRFAEVCAIDKQVIETIGEAIMGTEKPFLVTSGTAIVAQPEIVSEHQRISPTSHNPRIASEIAVDIIAEKGCKVAVVRLPPSVHGEGDLHGFVPILVNLAREKGKAGVINGGQNVWPAVHRLDAARAFRLALESSWPSGTRFHAVAEQGIEMKTIAGLISQHLDVPLVSLSTEEAAEYFTWFVHFASFNNPTSSEITKAMLNWEPTAPSLIEDLETKVYFQ